jgi:3-oxosteroid 1-dehydrogenase
VKLDAEYDVVILGSGIAGLAAALAAHEHGFRPLLIEKADKLGGGTTNSYGLVWIGGNHIARAAGYEDNRDDVLRYMRFLAAGEEREANLQALVDWSPKVLSFFETCGVQFRLTRGLADHYFGVAPGGRAEGRTIEAELVSGYDLGRWRERVLMPAHAPAYITAEEQIAWGGINRFSEWDAKLVAERKARDMRGKGVGLICQFLRALLKRKVAIVTGAHTKQLLTRGGRVNGIELEDGRKILARSGVVIATGSYESNPDLVRAFEGVPSWLSICPPSITGDGYFLASDIGAAVHVIRNNMQLFLAFAIPAERAGEQPDFHLAGIIELCSPHTLVVNQAGQRFADETYFQGMVPALRLFDPIKHRYPNLPCYLVFDQHYAANFSFAGRPAGAEIPPWVHRAETPGRLADQLGVDANGLLATLDRFNGYCRAGADPEFQRGAKAWRLAQDKSVQGSPNQSLGPLTKPPFYGVELKLASSGSAGLLTDETARVLNSRGQPIGGLYAAGNAVARVEFGAGYQAGLTLASGMTFGYLAIADMASRATAARRTGKKANNPIQPPRNN